jgi:hypothetical protein
MYWDLDTPPTMEHRCERCGEQLNPKTAVYLELSTKTGRYTDLDQSGMLPESESQGCFPFGRDCAVKAIAGDTKIRRRYASA